MGVGEVGQGQGMESVNLAHFFKECSWEWVKWDEEWYL